MNIWQLPLTEFEFLTKDNYTIWKSFMQKLLCCYGQEHWDIVSGKSTREDAQDKQHFDLVDEIALNTISLAIDKTVHPWVLGQFSSSKALWDSIEEKFQRKDQKKLKKREKQKKRKLKQQDSVLSDLSTFIPVPEIQDSDPASNCFADFLAELPCMENPPQDSGVLENNKDCLTSQLFLDDVNPIAGSTDTKLGTEMVSVLVKENDMAAELLDIPGLLSDKIQQLEVPVFDDSMAVNSIPSVTQLVYECAMQNLVQAGTECYLDLEVLHLQQEDNLQSTVSHLDLQYEEVNNNCVLDNNETIDLFSGEEQTATNTQEFMAVEDEFVCELPWLEIDSKTSDFKSVLSQVSDHELPLYVNLHIPFSCPHDGNVEHHSSLNDSMGFVVYADIEGETKKLQVTYRCLHLRNQVLMIVDKAADQYLHVSAVKSDTLLQEFSGQNVENFYETNRWSHVFYASPIMDEVSAKEQQYCMEHFGIAGTRELDLVGQNVESMCVSYTWLEFDYGSPSLEQFGKPVTLRKVREWYRGRKLWFKTKFQWQSWFFMWLNLPHMLNFKTYNISGTKSKDKGQSWLLLWLSLLYFLSTA